MKRNGFTLPELLVSLTVIALLLALGGGSLITYGERQRARELEAHRQMTQDVLEQCLALEGQYPDPSADTGDPPGTPASGDLASFPKVRAHLKTNYHAIFSDAYIYTYSYTDASHASISLTEAP